MSKLYIIGTPIGNLGDITLRALATLKEVDLILCEDTRVTKKLLNKYNIKKPTMSYHAQSKFSRLDKIIELLIEGRDLALVSDAGTPTISDPGALLINKIREYQVYQKESLLNVQIIPIPGPTAIITALSATGFPSHEFIFLGFLPHKKGRETLFKEIAESKRTMIFYESPHRILKTLEALNKFCPNKRICLARELTKIYEEFKFGSALEILNYLKENPVKQKGEFTVLVNLK